MVTPSKCNENPVLTPICKTNLIVRLWTVFVKLRTLHVPDFPSKEGDRKCICHLPRYRVVMGVKYPSSPPMRIFSRAQERNSGNATPTGPRSFSPGRFGNKNASSTIDGSSRSSCRRLRKVTGLPPRLVPTKVGFLGHLVVPKKGVKPPFCIGLREILYTILYVQCQSLLFKCISETCSGCFIFRCKWRPGKEGKCITETAASLPGRVEVREGRLETQ